MSGETASKNDGDVVMAPGLDSGTGVALCCESELAPVVINVGGKVAVRRVIVVLRATGE